MKKLSNVTKSDKGNSTKNGAATMLRLSLRKRQSLRCRGSELRPTSPFKSLALCASQHRSCMTNRTRQGKFP
jgi:hypothetical protein